MKRVLGILIIMLSALSFIYAAGQGEQKAAGPVTLNYWTHEDASRTTIEEKYIADFIAANPSVKVIRTTQASDPLIELVQAAYAANQGPDIFNLQIENEYTYIANERVAPINPKVLGFDSIKAIADTYLPKMLDPVIKNGKLYGLPMEVTNWCLYINKNVFRSAGLDAEKDYPRTWEDMVRVCEKLTIRDGNIITRRGFDFRYPYYLVEFIPMVEQLGGKLVSDDGKTAIVNDAAWLKFLTYFKEWGPSGKNLGSPTYKASRSLFNKDNNDIGMCTTGLYQQMRIKNETPAFYNSKEWMIVPFPVFKDAVNNVAGCYYGQYCLVNAQSSKAAQDMAWKLIGSMLSHGEEYLAKVNIVQPTKALMSSETYKSMPYSDVFTKDMERGHIVYHEANAVRLQTVVRTAIENVMLAGVAPEKALAALKAQAQEILDEK
jgi:multiple sugar transport system substrate-binding protein